MRVVYFGTPLLAVPPLEAVAAAHEVSAVVCQPDRPKGRSKKPVAPPTKAWAERQGIPVVQPTKLNDGRFEGWLKREKPDVCALCAYGRLLKRPILDVPEHGFVNVHPSLLPKRRGPSPIQTAILEGEEATGVTIMRLDAGMDTGDILLQEELAILPEDTTASLSARLSELGATMLVKALALIQSGEAVYTPQDDSKATVTKPFEKKDGEIRWSAAAREIHNLVRAAIPWPVAHCHFKGKVCRIHKTRVLDEPAQREPGTVERVEEDAVVVATGDKLLAIVEFQVPGKQPVAMSDFLRGHVIKVGDVFEDV